MFGLVPFNNFGVKKTGDSFDDFVSGFFNDDLFSSMNMVDNFKADIKETPDEFIMEAELPGVKKEDIQLEYNDNILNVMGKRDEVLEDKNDNYIRKERRYGQFKRSFFIENINKENITASFNDGILQVKMPKINNIISSSNRIEIN